MFSTLSQSFYLTSKSQKPRYFLKKITALTCFNRSMGFLDNTHLCLIYSHTFLLEKYGSCFIKINKYNILS